MAKGKGEGGYESEGGEEATREAGGADAGVAKGEGNDTIAEVEEWSD